MRRRAIAIVLACLLTGVSSIEFSQIATAHAEEIITITFIYNDQFIIDDGVGPVIYTDVIQEPDAADPDPDLILITHDHFDHFDPVIVEQMANTNGSTVVGPNYVIDALEGSVPPEQLVRMDPPLYERMNLTILGINIQAYHGSVDNNSYRFMIGGGVVSIYHSGDNMQSDFEEYILNGYTELYNLNIAMLANWFELNSYNSSYHPDVMIEMHYGDFCYVYENYPSYITLYSEDTWQYQYIPTIDVRFGPTPIIDGIILPGEWDNADSIRFYNGQGEISVYFMHNATALFFMSHINDSTYYYGDDIVIGIDTEHNGGLHPQPDDYQFYIRRDVSTSEINRGSGSGWESVPEEEWAGHVWNETSSDASTWTAELSVSYSFLNITNKHQVIGIQFRSYDDNPEGWFIWPEGSDESWPNSWADMSSSDNWGIEYVAKTLYVGGTGAGNYSHIQWAIENASDGDTVYVFEDSSPYYENIIVDKSINLIGENRDTTIIDGSDTGEDVVYVNADRVNITGFTIIGGGNGIFLSGSSNNTITGNILSNNDIGIELLSSSKNKIITNNISSNSFLGIYLESSDLNDITRNNVSDSHECMHLLDSNWNNIINNNVSFGVEGLYLDSSSRNNITANTLKSIGSFGILLFNSIEYNLANNNMIENGIVILGEQIEHWNSHSIDTSNTVNGKSVYYWKNQTGGIVHSDAGQVILANCTNVRVENQELTNGSVGLELGFSNINIITNNTISSNNWDGIHFYMSDSNDLFDNNISDNDYGIQFDSSTMNNFTNNSISNNDYGILLTYSSENNIKNNTVSSNNWYGLNLYSSNGNTLTGNNVTNNLNGIYLYISSFNEIYHNNFIDNDNEPYDNRDDNYWDDGYPSGGNYWDDWTTPDDNSGPNQNEPGSDGIVDDPRAIEGGLNQDSYPVTTPNGWPAQPTSGPVHNIDTDDYFPTIQEAIDDLDTLDGHTIEVSSGTYYEHVMVDKMLTLIGEDQETTIINGSESGDVVTIIADWVNLTGFTITYSGVEETDDGMSLNSYNNNISGNKFVNNRRSLYLSTSNFNIITGNNFSSNSDTALYLSSSNGNFIYGNTFSENEYGISTWSSIGNNIIGNYFTSNIESGIYLQTSSEGNYVTGNILQNNEDGISLFLSNRNNIMGNNASSNNVNGIVLASSNGNNITSNNAFFNGDTGIYLQNSHENNVTDNTASFNNGDGFYLYSSNENNVFDNIVSSNNNRGLQAFDSDNNNISGNTVSSSIEVNIYVWSSVNNIITQNNIYSGNYGFYLSLSSNNRIYHNNIIDNTNQAYDNGNNQWDNGYPSGGNYWSDYSGIDEYSGPGQNEPGSDGIGDIPYDIDFDSQDNYPLMEPFAADTTPPQIISGPTVISLSDTSATIVWETDELSNSEVEYGETTSYGYMVSNSTYVIGHNISLTGLEPNTQYHYRVKSKDLAGNEVVSGDFIFTTSPPKPVHNLDKNTYYDTIQEAIDDADPGNTILASSGTYYENVVVDKTITLIGEDRDTTIIDGSGTGDVVLIAADWVNVTDFSITGSGQNLEDAGIELYNIENCDINNNRIYYNFDGIQINNSNNNIITSNNISYNNIAIYSNSSIGNTILDNFMVGNGIVISGASVDYWNTHDIDTTNSVNGKPVYYWKDRNGGTVPPNAGQIILANCDNVIIENQELINCSVGIELGFSSNNEIRDNTISLNIIYGLFMIYSHGNVIIDNTYSSNEVGICLGYSEENDIYGNIIQDCIFSILALESKGNKIEDNYLSNTELGIWLIFSEGNIIKANNISNNNYGIWLTVSNGNNISKNNISYCEKGIYLWINSSWNTITNNTLSNNNDSITLSGTITVHPSNNKVYHNNFINNTNQAYDDSGDNNWDNGYPSGGNYWSDYTGNDYYSGPYQNIEGSDGIGDTPYTNIQGGAGAQDNYPLVEDIYPPIIQLISPYNNTVIKPGTIINLSISDPNLYQVTYSKSSGPEQPLIYPYEIDTTGWSDENYILEIRATDTCNNERTEWFNFTIDSKPPSITLNSPDNNSYIIWYVEINLTITDDNLDKVSYIKDDESAKSLSYPYNIDTGFWEEGEHIIEVTAEDRAGNLRKDLFVFTKDTKPPVITLDSPKNNSIISGDLEINFTITDEDLDAVYYRINNDTYQVLPFPYRISIKGLQDGRYVIDIRAVDLASLADIDQYVFTKDTLWPEITLNSPENNTILMEASTLDFDISDANLDSVTYSVNQGTFQNFEEPYDIDTSDWDDDLYTIRIRAKDTADHLSEKWFIFRIDTSVPSISSTSPSDGESDVSVDGKIVIEFNEPMDCDSVESAISIEPYIEYTCTWTNDNKTLTINFLEPLEYNTPYQISISSNTQDLAGRKLDSDYNFGFTTVGKPKDEEGFPITLLLALLIAIVAAIVIVALVMAKKKKTPAEVVETQVEPIETPQPIQFTCSNCNNLLQVNDTGVTQNVACPFCSTPLTVQPRGAEPQLQEEIQQFQIEPETIPIMCPRCSYKFSAIKTDDRMKVQCPSCGASGTLRLP